MISGKHRPPIYRHSISTNAPTLRKCPTQQSESVQHKTSFDRELLVKNNQLLSHLITRSDNMINLKELLDSHYIKEESGRYLFTLDVTVALRECQQTIYIDNKVDIVKLEQDNRLEDQLTGLKQGYERGLRHCESLLNVLDRKEYFQVAYLNEKKSFENKLRTLQTQLKQLREAKEILEKQLQEEKEFAMEEKQKLKNQISKLQRQINIQKTEAYQARQRSQDISHFYQELQGKYKNLLKQGFKKENADSEKNKRMLELNKLLTREQESRRKPQKYSEGAMLQKSWQCQSPHKIRILRQQSKEPSETSTVQTRLFKTFENQPLKELPHNTSVILEKDNNQSSAQRNAKRSTL